MFPSLKRKTAGDIIYPQCFFQFSRVEKYSLRGNFRHVERNQKNTFTPYKCATNILYSITNIVGGSKIKRVELRTLQYYHPILK
jgi:hypothetical protein